MPLVRARVLVLLAACFTALAGCETVNNGEGPLAGAGAPEGDVTGSVAAPGEPVVGDIAPSSTGVSGEEPQDDINLGKQHYRQNSFGLAEQHFRRAAERSPKDLEAWVGLAASYDKLRRFDLADRAYQQAIRLAGPTPALLNNQGYSYLLRGDHRRAREILLTARAKDPSNPYIQNNLDLLDESFIKRKPVQ